MKRFNSYVQNVDHDMLVKQKEILLNEIQHMIDTGDTEDGHELDGLVSLIDALQDNAMQEPEDKDYMLEAIATGFFLSHDDRTNEEKIEKLKEDDWDDITLVEDYQHHSPEAIKEGIQDMKYFLNLAYKLGVKHTLKNQCDDTD